MSSKIVSFGICSKKGFAEANFIAIVKQQLCIYTLNRAEYFVFELCGSVLKIGPETLKNQIEFAFESESFAQEFYIVWKHRPSVSAQWIYKSQHFENHFNELASLPLWKHYDNVFKMSNDYDENDGDDKERQRALQLECSPRCCSEKRKTSHETQQSSSSSLNVLWRYISSMNGILSQYFTPRIAGSASTTTTSADQHHQEKDEEALVVLSSPMQGEKENNK